MLSLLCWPKVTLLSGGHSYDMCSVPTLFTVLLLVVRWRNHGTLNKESVGLRMSTYFSGFLLAVSITKIFVIEETTYSRGTYW